MPDERERDQLWKRIDSHAKRIEDVERGVTEINVRTQEHARQFSDLTQTTVGLQTSVSDLNKSMNQLVGGIRSLRWIGIALGALLVAIEIFNSINAAIGSMVP